MAMDAQSFYLRRAIAEPEPPPTATRGAAAWLRQRLFAGPFNTVLTIVSLLILAALIWPTVKFLLIDAVWEGAEPHRLSAGNGQARGRRLLAVHRRQVSPIHVRLLSARPAMARQSHLCARACCCWFRC